MFELPKCFIFHLLHPSKPSQSPLHHAAFKKLISTLHNVNYLYGFHRHRNTQVSSRYYHYHLLSFSHRSLNIKLVILTPLLLYTPYYIEMIPPHLQDNFCNKVHTLSAQASLNPNYTHTCGSLGVFRSVTHTVHTGMRWR